MGEEAQSGPGTQPHRFDAGERFCDGGGFGGRPPPVGVFFTTARVSIIDSTPSAATDT